MNKYETVVGLEVHAHLKTSSKMFCGCSSGPKGKDYRVTEKDEPNIRICPVCTGQPGTLPVPNTKAIEDTILLGMALGSNIAPKFNFERKNYYYPDLPKAYQITSSSNPPVFGGQVEIETECGPKNVKLNHIHLEEDAGKLTHPKSGDFSLVDLNRAGTPLLEIVTEPDMSNGKEAADFMKNLKAILKSLNISDADMEKGQMRCDANISVRKMGAKELGAKVEVKNINSFKMVTAAIDYESRRQQEALDEGKKIGQETRGWNPDKGRTFAQRSKEYANDYRYFPEPDIPPIDVGKGKKFNPERINDRLPELPKEKRVRFVVEYGISEQSAYILTSNLENAKYFEETIEKIPQSAKSADEKRKIGQLVANTYISMVVPKIEDTLKLDSKDFANLIEMIINGSISNKIAKDLIPKMLKTGKSPAELVKSEGATQISDDKELNKLVTQILKKNIIEVARYNNGEKQLYGFFVGEVMRASEGRANPQKVNEILRKELS